MDINSFLNPIYEEVRDLDKDIDEAILSQYRYPLHPKYESDEELEGTPKITIAEALQAIEKLTIYEEQQEAGNRDLITTLNRRKYHLQYKRNTSKRQLDIMSFFA
jgi:hypothetical protein